MTTRRGDHLYGVLDDCLERCLHGESMESCVTRYPAYTEHIRTCLTVAGKVMAAGDYEPPAEAKDRGRRRLLLEWESLKKDRRRHQASNHWRKGTIQSAFIAAAAGAVLLALGSLHVGRALFD